MAYTIDFETEKIISGSFMSPKPVGVSIKYSSQPSRYYAFGHPTNNNSTYEEVLSVLKVVYDSEESIVCHNAKFDLRICLDWFGLSVPDPSRIHDTMIMAYLIDPRELSLGLKDLAHKYCGMPPDDQKNLKDWIIRNVAGAKESNFGEYICMAPGDLVGKYAESDTDMTYALFIVLSMQVLNVYGNRQTITDAYHRERRILPIVIDLEARGINVSPKITNILDKLEKDMSLIDLQLNAYANGEKPGSKAMFNVLRKKGLIDESKIQYTDKGNPRYGKEFIENLISDKHLSNLLKTRSKLQKLLGTYVRPLAESASIYGGRYYPYYNQTRSEDDYGTRTGRFSSNFQQLPKDTGSNTDKYDGSDAITLPSVRSLIVPSNSDNTFIKRDFSGQELRVAAHFAEGKILKAYQDDPKLDVHSWIDNLIISLTGMHLQRTPVKMISFLKLYGGGPKMLSLRLGIPIETAYTFFNAYDTALPEFKALMKEIETLARSGIKIRTWGGRSYAVEEAKDGREFYYKLGNVLIQGSSADMTKEAMVRYYYNTERRGNLIMQVHDELVVECKKEDVDHEMTLLRWAMDEIPDWDVPLRSDGKVGDNLAEMMEYIDG